jgi:hypothetical protein
VSTGVWPYRLRAKSLDPKERRDRWRERVANRLDQSPIATKRKVAAIDRRIAGLTRRVNKLEKGRT